MRIMQLVAQVFLMATVVLGLCLPASVLAAESSDASFEERVRRVLHEHPDIVLDILRNNSETVLEVAQQGSILRKRKGMIAQWQQDAKSPKKISLPQTFALGNPKAPVTIFAFSDFTCGFCRQADVTVMQLLEKYQGKLRIVFCPLPKEDQPLSVEAAKYVTAAFLQDQQKAWALYSAIFTGVESLERDEEAFLTVAATKAGLNMKQLSQDLKGKKVPELLAGFRDEAARLDIQGTPYFFVNDLIIRGAVPKELFEEAIEMALELKKAS